MAEMRASPVVYPRLLSIAKVLQDIQGPMGQIIPGTDVNPFKLLPAAQSVENWAYGNSPFSDYPSVTNRRLPVVKTGRENEVRDLADVALMGASLPAAAKGVTRGANFLGDVMTQAVTRNPNATSMMALDEIAKMSRVPQMFDPALAKRVIPQTSVVDEAGNPRLMYHGTSKDIQQFKPGQTEASFISPDVKFAEKFSDYSQDRSIKEIADQIDENPAQKEQLLSEIIDKAMQRGDLTNVDFPYHQQLAKAGFLSNLDMYTKDYWLNSFMNRSLKDAFGTVGIGEDVIRAVSEMTTTGPNVLPVYVNAKNPFDYENSSHVNKVFRALAKDDPDFYQGTTIGKRLKRALASGDWDSIEGTDVQDAIRKLGFDGFYVKEHGIKNLGVYDPNQIKSAISDKEMMEQFNKNRSGQ